MPDVDLEILAEVKVFKSSRYVAIAKTVKCSTYDIENKDQGQGQGEGHRRFH